MLGSHADQNAASRILFGIAYVNKDVGEAGNVADFKHSFMEGKPLRVSGVKPAMLPQLDGIMASRDARLGGNLFLAVLVLACEGREFAVDEQQAKCAFLTG